jgi:SpoVK/Ycf46/Vps4 family AAA+-type ATPase
MCLGKTLFSQWISESCQVKYYSVSACELTSRFGEGEHCIKQLFQIATDNAPSIIIIDDFEYIEGEDTEGELNRRIKTELLIQLHNVNNEVGFIAATNRPWNIHKSLLRRLQIRRMVDIPDESDRLEIIMKSLAQYSDNHTLTQQHLDYLAQQTAGYTGADINTLIRDGLMEPIRHIIEGIRAGAIDRNIPDNIHSLIPTTTINHFTTALSKTQPSIYHSDLDQFTTFQQEHGNN